MSLVLLILGEEKFQECRQKFRFGIMIKISFLNIGVMNEIPFDMGINWKLFRFWFEV